MQENEQWGIHPIFELRVSSLGRVERIGGKLAKPSDNGRGYLRINWHHKTSGHQKTLYIHRLVAETFLGAKPNHFVVNHKDGVKLNNRLDNLEWVSSSENNTHAVVNSLRDCRFKEQDHVLMRFMRDCGMEYKQIAAQIAPDLRPTTVANIVSGVGAKTLGGSGHGQDFWDKIK